MLRSPSPKEDVRKTSSKAEKIGAELKNLSLKSEKIEDKLGPTTSKSVKVEESVDPKKDRKLEREDVDGINDDVELVTNEKEEVEKEKNPKEEEEIEEGFDPNAPSSSAAWPPNVPDSYKYDPEMGKVTGQTAKNNRTPKPPVRRISSSPYAKIEQKLNQHIPPSQQPLPRTPLSTSPGQETDHCSFCKLFKCCEGNSRRSQSRSGQVAPSPVRNIT